MKTGLVVVDAWSVDENFQKFGQKIHGNEPPSTWHSAGYASEERSPELKDVERNFSNFLNYVCEVERQKGTIIIHTFGVTDSPLLKYSAAPRPIFGHYQLESMESPIPVYLEEKIDISQLTVDEKDKITSASQLGKTIDECNLDEVYFCGFYFGKCVHMHIVESNRYLRKNNRGLWRKNKNIALNLCMVLPPPIVHTRWAANLKPSKPGYSWKAAMNEEIALKKYGMRSFDYFMWSPWRFEKILGRK